MGSAPTLHKQSTNSFFAGNQRHLFVIITVVFSRIVMPTVVLFADFSSGFAGWFSSGKVGLFSSGFVGKSIGLFSIMMGLCGLAVSAASPFEPRAIAPTGTTPIRAGSEAQRSSPSVRRS